MAGIFINYRSDDSPYAASLVDERVRGEFGADQMFLDCRDLHGGIDFEPELWRRMASSTLLLVLIGPNWLTLTDRCAAIRTGSGATYAAMSDRPARSRYASRGRRSWCPGSTR